jgi:hypothetical protein
MIDCCRTKELELLFKFTCLTNYFVLLLGKIIVEPLVWECFKFTLPITTRSYVVKVFYMHLQQQDLELELFALQLN